MNIFIKETAEQKNFRKIMVKFWKLAVKEEWKKLREIWKIKK